MPLVRFLLTLNHKESIMDDLIKQLAAKLVVKNTDCTCC